ncbi:hypothetical protein NDU88_000400, partial [Pleurodeles waltl]
MLIENDKALAGSSIEKLGDSSHSDSGEPPVGVLQGSLPNLPLSRPQSNAGSIRSSLHSREGFIPEGQVVRVPTVR